MGLDKHATRRHHVLVKVRYQFRLCPTVPQRQELARTFGACRFVYNWALRLRSDSYKAGKTINYNASSAALTALKKDPDHVWLNKVSCVPTQQALRHLQSAFRNFFEKRSAYPGFKRKHGKQAAEYTCSAFKWEAETKTLTLAKLGVLKVRWSREFQSSPTTVTITKDTAGRYFVTLCLDETFKRWPKTGEAIGIDLGISRLATLSNGERIANPKHDARLQRHLARAQRELARRTKGSNRRERSRLHVAKIQARIADSRADNLHKVTTTLVRRFDVICIEDLNMRGMVQNHCLARSLSDAALGTVSRMLEYKCDRYSKELKRVDRFYPSSKRCSACGHIVERLPLSVREWDCPECKTHHDRDENAAVNILTAGHAVTGRGGSIRRKAGKPTKRGTRRSVNQPVSRALHGS